MLSLNKHLRPEDSVQRHQLAVTTRTATATHAQGTLTLLAVHPSPQVHFSKALVEAST
jgi:hypothetical protein